MVAKQGRGRLLANRSAKCPGGRLEAIRSGCCCNAVSLSWDYGSCCRDDDDGGFCVCRRSRYFARALRFYTKQDFCGLQLRQLFRLQKPEEVLRLSSCLVLWECVSGADSVLQLLHAFDMQRLAFVIMCCAETVTCIIYSDSSCFQWCNFFGDMLLPQREEWKLHQLECRAIAALTEDRKKMLTPTIRLMVRLVLRRKLQDDKVLSS